MNINRFCWLVIMRYQFMCGFNSLTRSLYASWFFFVWEDFIAKDQQKAENNNI